MPNSSAGWKFTRKERRWLIVALCAVLGFGANLEKRTALRREPMTDLGVFCCAAHATWNGENLYAITDWHGWHYQYPPTLAILFAPLSHPVPQPPPPLAPGERRTASNTPWGYGSSAPNFFGLHKVNARFFFIVAVWYCISVSLVFLAAHTLACTLERVPMGSPPPATPALRSRWWKLRLLPLVVCAGSIGTDWSRGQVDILMLAAIAVGLYWAALRREVKAGICLAFPATVKMFPPLLLLYPMWRRRWHMAAATLVSMVVLLGALPAVTLGSKRMAELYRVWFQVLAKPALGNGTDKSRSGELTGMTSTDNQSLLAAIHNWRYYDLPRRNRPQEASPWERDAVYIVGILLLAGIILVASRLKEEAPTDLLLLAGLLIGLTLVVSPIVHNYYYLLMLPMVTALVDRSLPDDWRPRPSWRFLWPVAIFMVTDIVVRLPGIGNRLRDLGIPLLSLLCLMTAGAVALVQRGKPTGKSPARIPESDEADDLQRDFCSASR